MLIIAHSYALRCPFSPTLKVNMEQWLLLNGGFNNVKAAQAGEGGWGEKGSWEELGNMPALLATKICEKAVANFPVETWLTEQRCTRNK